MHTADDMAIQDGKIGVSHISEEVACLLISNAFHMGYQPVSRLRHIRECGHNILDISVSSVIGDVTGSVMKPVPSFFEFFLKYFLGCLVKLRGEFLLYPNSLFS